MSRLVPFCGKLAFRCCKIKRVLLLPLQVTADCPVACECPAVPQSCPPGISLVPDGCGCCKVCAAQLNQDCHERLPCDHHKGLECNYGNDVSRTHGICRGTYTTEVGGKVESFWFRLGTSRGGVRQCVTSGWGDLASSWSVSLIGGLEV